MAKKQITEMESSVKVIPVDSGIAEAKPVVTVPEPKTVFSKCRRGRDGTTSGQSCDSMNAHLLTPEGSHFVQMRCKKCGYIWGVPLQTSIV
jgi:hypothetical protein